MFEIFSNVFFAALLLAGSELTLAEAALPYSDYSDVIPVEDLVFYENREGFSIANGWGDPAVGPHSNFIKMSGNSKSGRHIHSFDYYGVVIAGVIANEPSEDVSVRPLREGSFWIQKGNEPHITNCQSKSECVIFVTSRGPFDFHKVSETRAEAASR